MSVATDPAGSRLSRSEGLQVVEVSVAFCFLFCSLVPGESEYPCSIRICSFWIAGQPFRVEGQGGYSFPWFLLVAAGNFEGIPVRHASLKVAPTQLRNRIAVGHVVVISFQSALYISSSSELISELQSVKAGFVADAG